MNRSREPPLSTCERNFTLAAVREGKRLDGREVYDYRSVEISLGDVPGHVEARLGGTRVLARVSCAVVQPRLQRPTEGQLFFNVEFSPMASPGFEIGRSSSQATETGRILERCFKESRAVDTESLCIIAGAKVWSVRTDLHVLDHCGNIIDCAAIAAITALKHFRRPDVTVIGEEATIHPVTERESVPLSVHHMPLCITFAFFWDGDYLLVDPTHHEEAVMDGRLVVGMNVHREICALQMTGGVAILPEQVLRCSQIAVVKCAELTEAIKGVLSGGTRTDDAVGSILSTSRPKEELVVPDVELEEEEERGEGSGKDRPKLEVTQLGEGTAELGAGGVSTWMVGLKGGVAWSSEEDLEEDIQEKPEVRGGSSSEEESTVMLTEGDIGGFSRKQESNDRKGVAMVTKDTESGRLQSREVESRPDLSSALKKSTAPGKKKQRRKQKQTKQQ